MKRLFAIILLTVTILNIYAQPDSVYKIIQKANNYYKHTDYDSAIVLYKSVLKMGWESPYLYYNLANAYFRKGNLAKAIVNYERAYRRKPGDENIRHNLAFARQYVQDKFTEVHEFFLRRWWRALALSMCADSWAYLSVALFVITLVLALVFLFSKKILYRKLGFYIGLLTFILSILTLDLSLVNKHYVLNSGEAIVLRPTSVHSSPSNQGTELYILHQGVKVKILSKSDGWYEIKLPNGTIGWMPKNSLEKI